MLPAANGAADVAVEEDGAAAPVCDLKDEEEVGVVDDLMLRLLRRQPPPTGTLRRAPPRVQ